MSDFKNIRYSNVTRQKEWNVGSEKLSLSYKGNELAGEVGELCNVLKKLERERIGIKGSRASKEQAEDEIADVIICADLIAEDLNINLYQAVKNKFNKTSDKYNFETRFTEDVSFELAPQYSINEFILKFENGKERYMTDAYFKMCIEVLARGENPLNLIDQLLKSNFELQERFAEYVMLNPRMPIIKP